MSAISAPTLARGDPSLRPGCSTSSLRRLGLRARGYGGSALCLGLAAVVAACGAPPSPGSGGVAAPTPTPVAASAPTPNPEASLTARPTPLVSSKGSIAVSGPAVGEKVSSPLMITGEASVFEATVLYRVVTAAGKVLAEGATTASAGAPQKGTFRVEVVYETPYYSEAGFVEVFERSPKDGSVTDIARVPVGIAGDY